MRVSQLDLYNGFSISRTSQRKEKWFEICRNEGKFLLTCFGSIVNGTKRSLRIIEGLKKSGATKNRDSTEISKIVGKW